MSGKCARVPKDAERRVELQNTLEWLETRNEELLSIADLGWSLEILLNGISEHRVVHPECSAHYQL